MTKKETSGNKKQQLFFFLDGYKRDGKSEEDSPREMEGGPQRVLPCPEAKVGSQTRVSSSSERKVSSSCRGVNSSWHPPEKKGQTSDV